MYLFNDRTEGKFNTKLRKEIANFLDHFNWYTVKMYGLLRARRQRLLEEELAHDRVNGKKKAEEKQRGPWASAFHFFVENTSIPGIAHEHVRSNIFVKVFWVSLFCIGLFMGGFLSKNLLNDYLRYAVVEATTSDLPQVRQFPAITVCSNNPLVWTEDNKQKLSRTMVEKLEGYEQQHNKTLAKLKIPGIPSSDFELLMLKELGRLSETDRMRVVVPVNEMIGWCEFEGKSCSKSNYYVFNNLYYGTCVTFHPGIDPYPKSTTAGKNAVFIAVIRMNLDNVFPALFRNTGGMILFHGAGTPPILDQYKVIAISPGNYARFGISQKDISREKPPYPSACVDSDDPSLRAKNPFYHKNHKYLYSFEACLEDCRKRLTKEINNCVDPTGPVIPEETLCNLYLTRGNDAKAACDCPPTCNETVYSYKMSLFDHDWLRHRWWQDFLENAGIKAYTDEAINSNYRNIFAFDVSWASYVVEKVVEQPKIKIADLIGAVGGNLGLWVGISIMSLFEILEFGLLGIYKMMTRKKTNDPQITNVHCSDNKQHLVHQPGYSMSFPPMRRNVF